MKENNPIQRKVKAGGTVSAVAAVIAWALSQFEIIIPAEIALAAVTAIGSIVMYYVPNIQHAIEERLDTKDA